MKKTMSKYQLIDEDLIKVFGGLNIYIESIIPGGIDHRPDFPFPNDGKNNPGGNDPWLKPKGI